MNQQSLGELEDRLDQLDKISVKAGMEISLTKTEWMVCNYDEEKRPVRLRGKPLKRCKEFVYLGVVQAENVGSSGAVEARMGKATRAFRGLYKVWKQRISWETKGELYRTLVRSVLLAGAGTWTATSADFRLLEVWEANLV
eukprot:CAMPEP_0197862096 /NCGR_PEP_ID=MMETSP1438-20131217/38585_1 /TAXON_ID=1461541 /ORGANISM="Pterosperma sp., Strain CCMP1384" /LENGTH=140 /DNA_ID=CAMNT_0043479519 /DNA_START=315 /DNA_END=733 /DNA_ORIENTATION=-